MNKNIVADTSKYTYGTADYFASLSLIAAAQSRGEKIQRRQLGTSSWRTDGYMFDSLQSGDYRVEPKPEETFVVYRKDGTQVSVERSMADAEKFVKIGGVPRHSPYTIKHMVEAQSVEVHANAY